MCQICKVIETAEHEAAEFLLHHFNALRDERFKQARLLREHSEDAAAAARWLLAKASATRPRAPSELFFLTPARLSCATRRRVLGPGPAGPRAKRRARAAAHTDG
jgi:hypothetical protein